jgi:formate hydrogenlyase subunit 3/multisubunit Na+/H+ antiporter MnhD subunit
VIHSISLLLFLPFVGSAIALIGKLIPTKRPWEVFFSTVSMVPLAGMAVILALLVPDVFGRQDIYHIVGPWPAPVSIVLRLDGMAWLSTALVVVISAAAGIVALSGRTYGPRFYFFLMMLVAGMETVVLTADVFTMFVGFEIIALSAYVLIAYDRTDEGLLASLKYLILSSVGILFFLFGVFLLYRDFGTLSLQQMEGMISESGLAAAPTTRLAVSALVVGIGVRTAFIPFHTWLPEAHAYAPHPISAVLSGVLIKVSFFAMVRLLGIFRADYLMPLMMWVGGITAVTAVVWALAQSDAKRLLAYHSISQMGYVLAAFGAMTALSIPAAFFHAVNHAFFKSLLFLVVGSAIHMTGERNLYHMTPIGRRAPLLAIAFVVGAASIAGIPPFNGFAGKQMVVAALGDAYSSVPHRFGASGVKMLLSIASVGTVASFIKLARIVRPGPKREGPHEHHRPGVLVHFPVYVLALLCLVFGLFGREVIRLLAGILDTGGGEIGGIAAYRAVPATLFSSKKLLETAQTVVIGYVVYRLVVTATGKRISHHLQLLAPELRTVLIMFVLGLGVFAGVAYL